MWIKNTSGKKDAMLTFAFISFVVVTLNVLLSTIGGFSLRDFHISFQPLDAAIMSTYLGVAFSAYVGRRWTDRKYIGPSVSESEVETSEQEVEENEPPEPPPSIT